MAGSEKLVATLVDSAEAKCAAMIHLNQQLGRDFKNLSKIQEIVLQLQDTKQNMELKLQFVSTAAPDQMSQAVQAAEHGLAEADKLQEEAQLIQEQFVKHRERVSDLLAVVQPELQLLQQLDRVNCYQSWVRSVQQISSEMCNLCSSSNNESILLTRYTGLEDTLCAITGHTACVNLQQYVLHTVTYWHTRLLHTFSQEFEGVLKSMKYPFLNASSSVQQPPVSPELISRLQVLIAHLLRLHTHPAAIVASITRKTDNSKQQTAASSIHNLDSLSLADEREDDGGTSTTRSSEASACYLNTSLSSDGGSSVGGSDHYSTASSSPNKASPRKNVSEEANSLSSSNNEPGDGSDQPAIVADFAPLVTPLKLLLKPLEVRFQYHFSGDKKTNSTSHPEWCLTRVLNWVNAHAPFLHKHVQPVLDQCDFGHLCAKMEVTRGLVRLVVLKLSRDLSTVMTDEDLFCHSLQETLNFERELRLVCGYPASQPSVLVVLTQPQVLTHWIQLERKFAVAVMDELVTMCGAWESSDQEGSEGGGISACGEQFVTLLQGITDRYKPLPQPGHRLQFLEVQLDVLDEYRVRSAQLSRELLQSPVTSHYPAILNTLHHVAETLANWGDLPFFLELQVYRCQCRQLEAALEGGIGSDTPANKGVGSRSSPQELQGAVFDECVALYRHVQAEMLAIIIEHVMTELRARFMPYRRDKWFLEPNKRAGQVRCQDVSGSLCPLLEVLARHLHCLRRELAADLFTDLWHTLARDIDKFMFEELVLQNHFSDIGCAQFEYDMTRALFPMFSEFSSRPENHFPLVKESVMLLTLPLAPALLLRDTLRLAAQSTSGEPLRLQHSRRPDALPSAVDPAAALADHGLTEVTPDNAHRILNARNNITSL